MMTPISAKVTEFLEPVVLQNKEKVLTYIKENNLQSPHKIDVGFDGDEYGVAMAWLKNGKYLDVLCDSNGEILSSRFGYLKYNPEEITKVFDLTNDLAQLKESLDWLEL
jgi:hypothetical protein